MGEKQWKTAVAVSGLIWRGDAVLFLRRARPPIVWVPPGGRVEAGEGPVGALQREIREETSLEAVEIVVPCIAVAGRHAGNDMLFLDYACRYLEGEVRLDPREHDAWQWLELSWLETASRVEPRTGAGGEPCHLYRWPGQELLLSHSLQELRLSRRLLDCLD